jgi:two-component system, cell cycle response regulator
MAGFVVVMCGMSAKDARMVEIVVSRAPNLKYQYQLVSASNAQRCDIALVDAHAPTASAEIAQVRARFGNVSTVWISDDGTRGESNHKIPRRSLLLQILRMLDEITAKQMQTGTVASVEPPKPAAPRPANVPGITAPPIPAAPLVEAVKFEPLFALIVDDSLTVRTQLQGALDRIGIKSDLAENGQGAIDAAQKRRFDLMFLDVVMPGMDGYALCRQIKSAPTTRGTPVVMLTSRSSPFDRARGALAGCDTYLTKPIDLKSFYRAVDKVMLKLFKDDRKLMVDRGYKMMAL